jgi:hypothetical protein
VGSTPVTRLPRAPLQSTAALRPLLHNVFPSPAQALGGHRGYNASVSEAFIEAGMFDSAKEFLDLLKLRLDRYLPTLVEDQLALAQVAWPAAFTCSKDSRAQPTTTN